MSSFTTLSRGVALLFPLAVGLAACGPSSEDAAAAGQTAAVAVTAGGVTVDVIATQNWGSGFNGAVRVTNVAFPSPITSFQIVFKLSGTAGIQGNGWNGTISSPDASGNRTARNPAYMQYSPVRAGSSWDEGFTGTGSFAGSTIVAIAINGQNIPIGGDTTPPTVSLASSASNVTTAQTITLTATASDSVGVTRVEFYDGTTLLGSDTTSPYTLGVALTSASNGTRSYSARAYDAAGNVGTSTPPVSVVVNIQGGGDTVRPTVSLASSASNVTTAQTITLTGTASDNVGVTRVELYDGATLLVSDTTSPYTLGVVLTSANNGTHSYSARAYDAAGNVGTSSAVGVSVNIPGGAAAVYTSSNGKFMKNGVEIKLYGLNWFGMETSNRVLHGLWTGRQLDDFLSDFVGKGFNALRLPLSPETINPGYAIDSGPYNGNDCAALCGKDGRTALEYTLQRMQAAGMYALLDFHTCNPSQLGSGLPGSPTGCSGYTLSDWLADLETLATLSQTYTNVIGIDLTNEPWALTWAAWSEDASLGGQQVLAVNPNITVWVEGVGNSSPTGVSGGANWGQNLYQAAAIPFIPASKLVFTPHSYGPSVAAMSYFSDPTFPANMPAIWDTLFGHLIGQGFTLVVGEYGGQYTGADKTWHDAFATYLLGKNEKNTFYWCVNPNSGDTGGVLLDDWRTWNGSKLAFLQQFMR